MIRKSIILLFAALGACAAPEVRSIEVLPVEPQHNVILFVADGLRGRIVDQKSAPAIAELRDSGSYFPNSHSIFPTFTTANASAIATGHQLGDTGDFSNTIYTARAVGSAGGSVTPFLENDAVLREIDAQFHGNYLDETTILEAARLAGYGTAAIGKLGPTLIQDHLSRNGQSTIIIDDSTGTEVGIPLSPQVVTGLTAAGLPTTAPSRGENDHSGSATVPGTLVPNRAQQDYFVEATTRVVLPALKARGRPFILVFWSRDPDGSQHNQGDSLNQVEPGINGPTSLAAIRNADGDLQRLRDALSHLGLASTTDIIITSDHGFSTISKSSHTSPSARVTYADVPRTFLPPGFLALDLASTLHMRLFDPEAGNREVVFNEHPRRGSALLGDDPLRPRIVVAANGGSDLIYLPDQDRVLARQVVAALLKQDYVDGIFVDDSFGEVPGTLPMSAINLDGASVTPRPSVVVNFRTWASGCARSTNCQVEIADTTLQQGQGMHGSFGRGDTLNFTAAVGPDFKRGFVDPAPVSNADVGMTLARLLHLSITPRGHMVGRPLLEAFPGQIVPEFSQGSARSARASDGSRTVLEYQSVGTTRYLDSARRELAR